MCGIIKEIVQLQLLVALHRLCAEITTYEYSRTVKTKTMSAARFATLTAEEKVILFI